MRWFFIEGDAYLPRSVRMMQEAPQDRITLRGQQSKRRVLRNQKRARQATRTLHLQRSEVERQCSLVQQWIIPDRDSGHSHREASDMEHQRK